MLLKLTRKSCIRILIVIGGLLLFLPGLGIVNLFDWDEINFAESAREMLLTGDYLNVQINFETFWEKPPLFIWMQAFSMKIFGVNEMAARLPNAIAGILTLLLLFNIGTKVKSEKLGLLWVIMYACSFLPFFYFKSGIIDPWFNLFIFLGIYCFTEYLNPLQENRRMLNAGLSAACIGLGILTKGPVAFLIFALCFLVYLCFHRFRIRFRWKDVFVYFIVLAIVGGAWFILQILNGNFSIIQDFIAYQIRLFETKDAGHGGFLLYHFVVVFMGVFPASIFALPAFNIKNFRRNPDFSPAYREFFQWNMISLWVVLILFTIVKTKIVHYSSFCYFPLTFLAAHTLEQILDRKMKYPSYLSVLFIVLSIVFGIVITTLTLFDRFKEMLYPYISDPYTLHSMEATSEWIGFEPFIGLILVAATILFVIRFRKKPDFPNLSILTVATLFYIFTTMLLVVGEVEKYSQKPAIDFYKSKAGEDCYIYSREKSYGKYYYSRRQPQNNCDDFQFLSQGAIEKPCYFVIKNNPQKVEEFVSYIKDAEKLYSLHGFVFYVRNPQVPRISGNETETDTSL